MGLFDKITGSAFGDKPREGAKKGPADFSDVRSESTPAPRAPAADFSGVTSGESTSAPDRSAGRTYTVQGGDSLSKIAKSQYGDASQWKRIYEANRDKIKNPDLIRPGQELTIPGA